MNFFNTFRGRLLLILAFLLIVTLGVQYYLNLLTQQENIDLRDSQTQALVAGIAVGTNALTASEDRVKNLVDRPEQTFMDESAKRRIKDIIIIDSEWQITDSLNPDYLPTVNNDEYIYKKLSSISDLPPLMEGNRLGTDLAKFPNQSSSANKNSDDEAHAVPIETSKGRWYVMVLLRNDKSEAARRAAQPLIVTLAVLLISTLITLMLVWRFTEPIANLSNAARRVADGDLSIRVPDHSRNDEMGQLAQRFNEMTAELEKSKELEAQLQQAEKSAVIGRLGSAIAHEIRNPLNYINLTLDHLRSKFAPDDKTKREVFIKLTSQLKSEVARINQQISDFLSYSRPSRIKAVPINVREIIDDSLRLIEGQAEETGVKISLVEHESVPFVAADPEFLRSVFNNLFINAVQAMGANGGKLNVKIEPGDEPDFIRIDISDTGSGIAEANLPKIFEPYFSTKETGTGLGLAIVHKVVEMHKGQIAVESVEGTGTTFTVKLPTVK